ncbi:hypothetical protein [Petrocella sp. FN5]|uniref:hypothetical protein n=1 Tax=Petrocella sp. FN5 TaxID=3032002 RepID=UPI0023D97DA7|nr:hypothetical protein [Petrocella sp. FN5]MDF1617406.1 hypothetical protein [Petrocella sp. FN5]
MQEKDNILMNKVLENNDMKKIVITEDDNFVIKTIYDKISKSIIVEEKNKETGLQSKTITKIGIEKTTAISA